MSTRPTMADVAQAAGVSTMSVSYTYNQPTRVSDATRRRVLDAAAALGYTGPHRAARSLRSGKTNNLGVVLTEKLTYSFENPEARAFLSGIAEACLATDTGLVLLPNSRIGVDLDRIRDAHVDGYVLWTTVVDDPVLDIVTATGKPACIQGGPIHTGIEFVGIDDAAAAHAIGTVALVGAQRPAIISFPRDRARIAETILGPEPENATFPVTASRLAGYRRAVVEYGLGWENIPVAFAATNARAEGEKAARALLDEHRSDVIICTSDDLALGALDAGARRVTGWDDSEAAESAGLTTVAQSLYDQGHDAARWVLGTLERIPVAEWSVVDRGSTAR